MQHRCVVGNWSWVWPWALCVQEGVTVAWGCVPHRGTVVGSVLVTSSARAGGLALWGGALTISEILTFSLLAGQEEAAGPREPQGRGSHSRPPSRTVEVAVLSRLGLNHSSYTLYI